MNLESIEQNQMAAQSAVYAVKTTKMANDQQKLVGEQALKLIQSAVVAARGTGQTVDIVA